MRVALHFDPDHELLDPHGGYVTEVVLGAMIGNGKFATRVHIGDLMLRHDYAMWITDIYSTTRLREYSEKKHTKAAATWLISLTGLWKCFLPLNQIKTAIQDMYVVCLESVSLELAKHLSFELGLLPYFFGATEVDEGSPLHRRLYMDALMPWVRIDSKSVYVLKGLYDDEGSLDSLESFIALGAVHAEYEDSGDARW